MKYGELKDAGLAKIDAAVQVDTTLKRLKAIEKINDELYINALQSSALLCLADVRGLSPYHSFSRQLNQKELSAINEQLYPLGLAIFSENLLPFNPEPYEVTVFSFVNVEALKTLPKRYTFLADVPYPVLIDGRDNVLTSATWDSQNFRLARLMIDGLLPKTWLKDWFAPNDLRFGMQLGYPGAAIAALLWSQAEEKNNLVEIIVDDAEDLDGTWVSFGVAHSYKTSPEVRHVADLWIEIIQRTRKRIPIDGILSITKFEKAFRAIANG